jgi:hypothetical protein
VGVAAEGDVELRPVPERAVDEARGPRITQRVDVDRQRLQHRLRRLLQAAEDCLTADDDELVKAGHVRGGRDDMRKLIRTQARSPLARFAGAQAR